jgi:hypothetical protein
MPQVSFPILAVTDATKFGELPALFAATTKSLAAQKLSNAILIYEVCDAPEWSHATIKPVEHPDRMMIMVYDARGRDAIVNAILNAKAKRPQEPFKKKLHITAKAQTPLRSIYKQMAELPLTEFNLTPDNLPGAAVFFLRTPELVADFRQELPKVSLG